MRGCVEGGGRRRMMSMKGLSIRGWREDGVFSVVLET